MLHFAALLNVASLLSPGLSPEPFQDGPSWRALPLPTLCNTPTASARMPVIEHGRHLLQSGEDPAHRNPAAPAHLPVAMLLGLLSDEAARRGLVVEFQPTAPPLLARGSASDLEAIEALLADIDRAGRALEVHVEAWLTAGATDAGAYPSAAAHAAAVDGRSAWADTRLRSGGSVMLGTRATRTFVRGYDVELASDSGVAAPVLGTAIVGTTVHLTASRTDGGRSVHVEGFLDFSELLSLEAFDTHTFELGLVQQPRLGVLQVAFSGSVTSAGLLAVSFAGAPLEAPDQTLWLRLTCEPDPAPEAGWRGLDVALLERRALALPLPDPGAGLAGVELPSAPRVLAEPLPASALAQAFSRSAQRGAPDLPVWTRGYLLAPAEAPGWDEVDALVAATHAAHAPGATLTLTQAALRVQLPLAERVPARLLAGVETTLLSDYDVAVAPEVWLPEPVIEPVFDGLLVQGALESGAFRGSTWSSLSRAAATLERQDVGLGRLQLSHRGLWTARCALTGGAAPVILLRDDDAGGPGTLSASLELK